MVFQPFKSALSEIASITFILLTASVNGVGTGLFPIIDCANCSVLKGILVDCFDYNLFGTGFRSYPYLA